MTARRSTSALTASLVSVSAAALMFVAGPAHAQAGPDAPDAPGTEQMDQRMHEGNPGRVMQKLMRDGNPGMTRMKTLMQQGNPGMARMHERMMPVTEGPS